jgi:hypothetical protein
MAGRIEFSDDRLKVVIRLLSCDAAFHGSQPDQFHSAVKQEHAKGDGVICTHVSVDDQFASHACSVV